MKMATRSDFERRRIRQARWVTLVWLASGVFTSLLMPGIGVLREYRAGWAVLGAIGIVAFAVAQGGVTYGAVTDRAAAVERGWRRAFVTLAVVSVGLVGPVAEGQWPTWAWLGAAIVGTLPLLTRARWATLWSLVTVGVGAAVAFITGGSQLQSVVIIGGVGAGIAFINAAPVWLWKLLNETNAARESAAALAATEERLRFAREVHDILGHALTVIALKAELLERRSEDSSVTVADDARDIRQLARTALADVRAAVAGSRDVDLAVEMASLSGVLEASGIRCDVFVSEQPSRAQSVAVAMILREAITNVLRHSRATRCTVSLGRVGSEFVLTVRNDGVMGPDGRADAMSGGLEGVRERLQAWSGELQVRREGRQFELQATWPVTA